MRFSGLGLSQTYVDAQRIVTAIERAQTDESYYASAVDILNSYVEPERTLVIEKAIALGADPEIVRALAVGGETIEIIGKGPGPMIAGKRIPWWALGLGGLGALVLIGSIAYRLKKA